MAIQWETRISWWYKLFTNGKLPTTIILQRIDIHHQKNEDPLNIVLFDPDDWTMKVLGKLNPDVLTPNIDRTADNGVPTT